jgi:tetratricopeptide (TPR) repeat protein
MQRRCLPLLRFIRCASLLAALLYPHASPAQTREEWIARAVSVQGTVEVQRVGETLWQPVKLNDQFRPGDQIRVLDRSRADVALLDQSVLRLNENTTITIQAVKDERTGVIDLLRGAAHFFSRGPGSLDVQTPFAIAGVRGTEFFINVETDRALLTTFEGTVVAENSAGSLTLTSGQSAVAEAGRAPVLRVVARPRDAVQWALYYLPVLYLRPDEFPPGPGWQGMVRQSLEFYLQGDLQKAFNSIATVPGTISDPRFLTYRASLLLAVGRVDEANADIGRALNVNPNDSNALALQTIIAVVQNEQERAFEVAQKAVGAAPNSATALVALSYAQQARFDLEGARASLQKAVDIEPQNALAWARLAELWSSFAELDQALSAAQQAVALEPNLSRTQTVLGFAYLTQVKTQQAKEAFEKAIAFDQADPLARLGLGLAKIREGGLYQGGRDLEIAASLDPNNSLVRSYLGKTYYEEKRIPSDEREYTTAKGLDLEDPTPWLYDAIAKQTTNRPVEALHDAQKAIELNNNRAVYRSRLLLDSDLAARSASLARIYSDLGFQELALVEGWKSVNIDPSNFSAHRFLADSYSTLPRHEIARVSELLQSQLLQPLNMTPIQPRLEESNLFLISSGGPGALAFNEFNPLFNRNGINVQSSGLSGENDTYGGEGVISGIYNKTSFSLGGFHLTTDGFRRNADQQDDIANAFVQFELSPQTSIQAEYRYRNTEHGDLQTRFFSEDFFPGLRDTQEKHTYRLGGRHTFSPGSILLGSFIYQDFNEHQRDSAPPFPGFRFVDFKFPLDAFSVELQHLFRSQYFNLTSGVGYADSNGRVDTTLGLDLPPPPIGPGPIEIPLTTDTDIQHTNFYAYSYINFLKNVTLTVGFSADFLRGASDVVPHGDKDQFNPKFGITWEPIPGTTLRAAAFRVLKRTLISDQTLEPTQVAGFNQFYDDVSATEAWRYGGAIDQKFTQNIFGGVEFAKRDLKVPLIDLSDPANPITREFDADEYLGRSYLFWTPHEWLALRAEYLFERFKNEVVSGEEPVKLNTHRVPVGFSFFHPSGLGAALTATYWNQDGKFQRLATGERESGSDDFWTVDAALNYRLPRRYGFITVGATNLFDEKFKFFNTDFDNPLIQPDRMFFARVTLALPFGEAFQE